jgi:hypothetical protein
LVTAKLDRTYEAIQLATRGIVFFATPHQGGNYTKLGEIAAKIAKKCLRNEDNSFVEALKKDTLFGEELIENFRFQLEDFNVLSFVETLPYRKLGLVFYLSVSFSQVLTALDCRQEICNSWSLRRETDITCCRP